MLTAQWSMIAAFAAMGALSAVSLLAVLLFVPPDHARERKVDVRRGAASPTSIVPMRQIAKSDAVKALLSYFATRGFWRQGFKDWCRRKGIRPGLEPWASMAVLPWWNASSRW